MNKDQLGGIGDNKLLLITTIKILDDYFNLKQKVDLQKNRLEEISKKFLEMKSLAIRFKENKDAEVNNLKNEIDKFKATIDESNSLYESILDKTTKSLQDIINKAESKSELQ